MPGVVAPPSACAQMAQAYKFCMHLGIRSVRQCNHRKYSRRIDKQTMQTTIGEDRSTKKEETELKRIGYD